MEIENSSSPTPRFTGGKIQTPLKTYDVPQKITKFQKHMQNIKPKVDRENEAKRRRCSFYKLLVVSELIITGNAGFKKLTRLGLPFAFESAPILLRIHHWFLRILHLT